MYLWVRVSEALETELQTGMSWHAGAGIEPGSCGRAAVLLTAESSPQAPAAAILTVIIYILYVFTSSEL